jgi:hypothetical protein
VEEFSRRNVVAVTFEKTFGRFGLPISTLFSTDPSSVTAPACKALSLICTAFAMRSNGHPAMAANALNAAQLFAESTTPAGRGKAYAVASLLLGVFSSWETSERAAQFLRDADTCAATLTDDVDAARIRAVAAQQLFSLSMSNPSAAVAPPKLTCEEPPDALFLSVPQFFASRKLADCLILCDRSKTPPPNFATEDAPRILRFIDYIDAAKPYPSLGDFVPAVTATTRARIYLFLGDSISAVRYGRAALQFFEAQWREIPFSPIFVLYMLKSLLRVGRGGGDEYLEGAALRFLEAAGGYFRAARRAAEDGAVSLRPASPPPRGALQELEWM